MLVLHITSGVPQFMCDSEVQHFVQWNGPETKQVRASALHLDEERFFQESLAFFQDSERRAIGIQPPGLQDYLPVRAFD